MFGGLDFKINNYWQNLLEEELDRYDDGSRVRRKWGGNGVELNKDKDVGYKRECLSSE